MTDGLATATGRVAFVTGAAQGLGAAIAEGLCRAGHFVMLGDLDGEGAARVAASIDANRAASVALDVRDRSSVRSAVRACTERFGAVDILVNNAALTRAVDFFDLTEEEWDEVMQTNLRSGLLTCQECAPGMIDRGFGRILNLASVAGQRGGPSAQGLHYATSKAGIIGMTRHLAHLFAGKGITVNAIAPGPIEGEQVARLSREKREAIVAAIPAGRFGRAEEVAALAVFLASEEAGFVTGATYDVNGGVLMR